MDVHNCTPGYTSSISSLSWNYAQYPVIYALIKNQSVFGTAVANTWTNNKKHNIQENIMNTKLNTRTKSLILVSALFTFALFTGCSKDSPVAPIESANISYDESSDMAESVADNLGEDTGGMMDQVNDMIMFAGEENLAKTSGDFFDLKDKQWDESTKTWTITLERERGYEASSFYAYIERVYKVQFFNSVDMPQQFFITNGDTARTMTFEIVSGSGRHKTLKISQELQELEGNFVATGIQTDTVTINGTYRRSAVDTLTNATATRIHSHSTELNISDLKGQRGYRGDLSLAYSGTITGTHTADIHWSGEKGEQDKTVSREIYIVIEDGQAVINMNNSKYNCNLVTGELN